MRRRVSLPVIALASTLMGLTFVHSRLRRARERGISDPTAHSSARSADRQDLRPDPEDPWVEKPEEDVDAVVNIAPAGGDDATLREELHIPQLRNKAPNPVMIQLIDIMPTLLGMLIAGLSGYWGGFIGNPGDADPTGALFGLYGIQATLIVSVAFLPKTLNQLTFGIIQLLVVVTAITGVAYAGFHFMWFGEKLGFATSIFLSLFCVIFSALSVTFSYSSRYWRATAHRKEKKVNKRSTTWTRWRLRRSNLMAYREWCWRHNQDPERFEQQLWESGAFALTFSELEDAQGSPALDDFLDSRRGIEAKDSR